MSQATPKIGVASWALINPIRRWLARFLYTGSTTIRQRLRSGSDPPSAFWSFPNRIFVFAALRSRHEVAAIERQQPLPVPLGGIAVVDRTFREGKAVMGAGIDLDLVLRS